MVLDWYWLDLGLDLAQIVLDLILALSKITGNEALDPYDEHDDDNVDYNENNYIEEDEDEAVVVRSAGALGPWSGWWGAKIPPIRFY